MFLTTPQYPTPPSGTAHPRPQIPQGTPPLGGAGGSLNLALLILCALAATSRAFLGLHLRQSTQTPTALDIKRSDLPQTRQVPTKKVEVGRNMFLA
jgi:hypothetical protein